MPVTVKIGQRLSESTGGEMSFVVDGTTLGEVVGAVDAMHPGFRDQILRYDGIHGWLSVEGGGRQQPFRLATDRVTDGTVVTITMDMAGG
jgi:hypothetical protein